MSSLPLASRMNPTTQAGVAVDTRCWFDTRDSKDLKNDQTPSREGKVEQPSQTITRIKLPSRQPLYHRHWWQHLALVCRFLFQMFVSMCLGMYVRACVYRPSRVRIVVAPTVFGFHANYTDSVQRLFSPTIARQREGEREVMNHRQTPRLGLIL